MKVRFQLWGQLRKATGIPAPEVELSFGSVAADAIKVLADDFPDLQSILLDDGGEVRPIKGMANGTSRRCGRYCPG